MEFNLKAIVRKHVELGTCSHQKLKYFKTPRRRALVAGYKWILTPGSMFVGYFLQEFMSSLNLH